MDPVLKTDAWGLVLATCGFSVSISMNDRPAYIEDYTIRLNNAAQFMGLDCKHIYFNTVAERYEIGSGSIRLIGPEIGRSEGFWFRQFCADDTSTIVEGRDIFDLATEFLDLNDDNALDSERIDDNQSDPCDQEDIESFGL